jgi:hypothetical protein
MSSLKELKSELRALRVKHCPPLSRLKKIDVEKEVQRLRTMEQGTAIVVQPKVAKVKKVVAKKETREMEVQTEPVSESDEEKESMAQRMVRVRAGKKISSVLKKAVEVKKAKAKAISQQVMKAVEGKKQKKEQESMASEDRDVGKTRRKLRTGGEVIAKVNKIETAVDDKPKRKLKSMKISI